MKMVAFLRAVNVTGKNAVPMADLADMFRSLGFTEVQTYKQSGNVVFEGTSGAEAMEEKIEKAIVKRMGLDVKVIVRTKEEMGVIVKRNPFHVRGYDDQFIHVTLLKKKTVLKNLQAADQRKMNDEEYAIDSKNIYLYCPNGYGRTKLNNANMERWVKQSGTTRNWRTVQAIRELLNQ